MDYDNGALHPATQRGGTPHTRIAVSLVLAAGVAIGGAIWARSGESVDTTAVVAGDELPTSTIPQRGGGEIRVRLEPVSGFFIEGFEIGLRIETADGTVIASTLWSDYVRSKGATDLRSAYDTVLIQSVPPGEVLVAAEVNIGPGGPPSIPDVAGELPCELLVAVEPGASVTVEVLFDAATDCLRQIDPAAAADAANGSAIPPAESTTTTSPTITGALELAVGSTHYVDVDLRCEAFELDGVWVLVDGDTTTWQPPGERHEGGGFTIERDDFGRFVGDAQGRKTATFRRLAPDEQPPCAPVPR